MRWKELLHFRDVKLFLWSDGKRTIPWIKVIGIRPMDHLKISEHEMLSFSVRKEIIKNDNSLVVILLSKVVENEFPSDFIANSQSRIVILPLFIHA